MNWPETILKGIENVLERDGRRFNLHYEALDSKEFNSDRYYKEFINYLGVKYEGYDFSFILSSDNNAFDLLRDIHKSMFPGVPVVFCGVNDFDLSMIKGHEEFTGLMELPSVLSTVKLMLTLHPDTEELYVINDYLNTGRAWQKQIESDLENLDHSLTITYSENLPLLELQKKITSLSDKTLILSGVYFTDKDGIFSSYEEMAERIASTAEVPFYTLVDFNIQKGVAGGKVISGTVHGETISKIGLRILDGESPGEIPVGREDFNRFIFNFPEIQKFNIPLDSLPDDSLIINRPFSLYEEYTAEILLILLVICLLVSAVLLLFYSMLHQKQSEQTLQQFSDATWEGIIIHDKGKIIQTNAMFSRIFGYTNAEMAGEDFVDKIIAPGSHNLVRNRIYSEKTKAYETIAVRKDGSFLPAEIRVRNITIKGRSLRFAAIRDLSDMKKAEQEFAYLQSLWDKMFENSIEAIFINNSEGTIERVNKSFLKITGFLKEDIIGKDISTFFSEYYTKEIKADLTESLNKKGSWTGELLNRRQSGEIYSMWLRISYFYGDTKEEKRTIGIFTDISEKKKQEEELTWMSKYDALTGFSNRTLFLDILNSELKASDRSNEICAVMILNLDGLKNINNNYGFLSGDMIIKEFSERLKAGIRDEDLVSRFGGDEFAVLAPRFTDKNQVDAVIKRIREIVLKPITIDGNTIDLSVSIGVSLYPSDGTGEQELIAKSETALKRTKANRKGSYSFFNSEQDKAVMLRSELEIHLQKAIIKDELDVFYQPKVNPANSKIKGFEALVRWHRNKEEWIPPDVFIPISEGNGFIIEIGNFVLNKACEFILKLKEQGYDDFHVGVNISAKQFSDPLFIDKLIKTVESKGINPRYLDLEVTESITASKVYNTIECLTQISEYGFSISIDDFGTGYSSLQYLLNLPFDTMKIDKSFVDSILEDENHLTVLDTLISLAHSLNKEVVAEGAEAEKQIKYLKDHDCESIQGYYYSRPLPASEVLELMKSDKFH